MTRWLPAVLIFLLGAALLLLLWLTIAPSRAKQVQALPATRPMAAAPAKELSFPVIAGETAVPSGGSDNSPINEDLVSTGPHRAAPPASLENASGPEIAPGLTPGIVLENMRSVIRNYSTDFGGNPFGNNREITARLNGGNPKQIVFLKEEDGMRINERGELIDNWGTPFFFHQISGAEMEIRSAGPDRKMWTRDDLIIK